MNSNVTAPEDESIISILRERQGTARSVWSSSTKKPDLDSESSHSAISSKSSARDSPTPNTSHPLYSGTSRSAAKPKLSPSPSLSRENSFDSYRSSLLPKRGPYAESYVSHTTSSINEVDTIFEQDDIGSVKGPSNRLKTVARLMSKSAIKHDEVMQVAPPEPPTTQTLERSQESQKNVKVNRTLFMPLPSQETPRKDMSDEYVGYISPPHSRRTSPEDLIVSKDLEGNLPANTNSKLTKVALGGSHHSGARVLASPTPAPVSQSPRSRLTRTLLEIQAELAESRECIDAMETRVGVLEQHQSLDRDMLQKHVEDCIQHMAEEVNLSMGSSEARDTSILLSDSATKLDEERIPQSTLCEQGDDSITVSRGLSASTVSATENGLLVKLVLPAKVLLLGVCGALAAEWIVMTVMNELGRRQVLVLS